MDSQSVIGLGHSPKQPLMRPSSDLSYGLEPHDHIYPRDTAVPVDHVDDAGSGGVPGVVRLGGYPEGCIPGQSAKARLRLIYGIIDKIRFILPFD